MPEPQTTVDDSADFGMYVRRSTAAQCAATKVTTEYPIQRSAASIGVLRDSARFEPPLLQSVTLVGPQLLVNTRLTLGKVALVFRG